MKTKQMMLQIVVMAALVVVASCGGDDGDDGAASGGGDTAASTGCAWHGNCSTTAKEGSYDCSGNTLMQCQSGQWVTVASCSSLDYTSGTGFTYACTCKGGCGTSKVECSYAFNTCGGQNYTQP